MSIPITLSEREVLGYRTDSISNMPAILYIVQYKSRGVILRVKVGYDDI